MFPKMHMVPIKNILWTLPFLFFFLSYFFLYKFFSIPPFATPCIVGKQVQDALKILSQHNLNVRLLSEIEDNDLPAGTVLSQQPLANQQIRPYQAVFLTISKKAEKIATPDFSYYSLDTLKKMLEKKGINYKAYGLMSPSPLHSCIAQIPQAKEFLNEDKKMIIYYSSGNNKPVILPSFKGYSVAEVQQFLDEHTIKLHIFHAKPLEPNHQCTMCHVIEQKPLAGSLIDLQNPPTIQLNVQ